MSVRPNLRGGDWFDHSPYLAVQKALLEWLDDTVARGLNVTVVEVGVGGNTPIVTRIPASSFASAVAAAGGQATYVRVNPDEPDLEHFANFPSGDNVQLFNICDGWRALEPIVENAVAIRQQPLSAYRGTSTSKTVPSGVEMTHDHHHDERAAKAHRRRYTEILHSLRTPK